MSTRKTAEEYLSWAGWFAHPTEEPGVCSRHAGWWQRERKIIQSAIREQRIVTPEELRRARGEAEGEIAARPPHHIPASVTLDLLLPRFQVTIAADKVVNLLRKRVSVEDSIHACTAFGEGHALLREKPRNGLQAYIWTQALVRRKLLASVPVTAYLDLEDGIYGLTGEWVETGADAECLYLWLDAMVSGLLSSVG